MGCVTPRNTELEDSTAFIMKGKCVFVWQETMPYSSRLFVTSMPSRKELSGPCILGITSKDMQGHLGPMEIATPNNYMCIQFPVQADLRLGGRDK